MTGHGAKFGRKQEEAVAALLAQRSVEEAAKAIQIAPKTLYRWMKEPAFDAAYRAGRRAAFGQATARLQQMSGTAVVALAKVLVDTATPPSTRVRAAEVILTQAGKAIEIEDIAARLANLERTVNEGNG